jgi:hypothetical protein
MPKTSLRGHWLQLSGVVSFFCLSVSCLKPRGTLWFQLLGVVWSLCLSISGLTGRSGSSCWVMSDLLVCQFRASGDTLALVVGYYLGFWSVSCLPQGHSGSSCQVLFGFLVCQFRASWDTLAPAVWYCLVFWCLNFGPQGALGLQPSGIVCFSLSVNFEPQGTVWLQLPGIVWSFCVSISGLREHSGYNCWVLSAIFVCSFCLSFLLGGRTGGGRGRTGFALQSYKPNLKCRGWRKNQKMKYESFTESSQSLVNITNKPRPPGLNHKAFNSLFASITDLSPPFLPLL